MIATLADEALGRADGGCPAVEQWCCGNDVGIGERAPRETVDVEGELLQPGTLCPRGFFPRG